MGAESPKIQTSPQMQRTLFITNVEHLKILSNLGDGEKIGDKLRITNDRLFIQKLITPSFHTLAGDLETHFLNTTGAVAYSIEESQPFPSDEAANSFLVERLMEVRTFLQMLWLVKDNSVNVDLGYLEHPYKSSVATKTNVTRNSIAHIFSNSQGEVLATEFSRDELRKARHLFREFSGGSKVKFQIAIDEGLSRFERAFYFMQAARASSDLGVKIANYCICFETLFSTDVQELSHKLGERIACFLEKDVPNRLSLFQTIKKAYAVRSKIVHGSKGSPKAAASIKESSVSCDGIVRRILLQIIEEPSFQKYFFESPSNKDLEDYFVALVLTGTSSHTE
ncbi:MAG: hypothetical protein ABSB22_17005 [Thermodesulfobacteriota bacterium]|jgi:hypothetical protein